jgi:hypothetical protein
MTYRSICMDCRNAFWAKSRHVHRCYDCRITNRRAKQAAWRRSRRHKEATDGSRHTS